MKIMQCKYYAILCGAGRIGQGDLDPDISSKLYLKKVNTLKIFWISSKGFFLYS